MKNKERILNIFIVAMLIIFILVLVTGNIYDKKRQEKLEADNVSYVKESKESNSKEVTVSQDGTGDYESINDAVQAINNEGTIHVKPGTYIESVKAWNKNVTIVGDDKGSCILKNQSGEYASPPLEIGAGKVENMTIHAERLDGAPLPNKAGEHGDWTSYGVHIETDTSADKTLTFQNCDIISNWNSAIGAGLRKNFTLSFENCNITTTAKEKTSGALYFHDSNIDGLKGEQQLIVKNCNLTSTNYKYVVTPYSLGHTDNKLNMTFVNNNFTSGISTVNLIQKWSKSQGDGWEGYNNFFLTEDSAGNNLEEFNYN